MSLSRRSLLLGLLPAASALAAGCVDERLLEFSVTESLDGSRSKLDAEEASLSATQAQPPALHLLSRSVAQGGTFLAVVTGDGVMSATLEFRGWEYPMVAEGGVHLAVVPAGQQVGSTEQPAPGAYPLWAYARVRGEPEPRTLEASIVVGRWDFTVEHLSFAPSVAALLDPALTMREVAILREAYGGFTAARLWDGFFVRPSAGAVSDVYGSRRSYQGGPVTGSHSGVDFGAAAGSPVYAAAGGRVVLAQPLPVRGNAVIVDHGAGVHTGYCHLSDYWVAPDQRVRAGEPIAAVGATGLVTGPHLHWEVVAGLHHVDGLRWLG